MRKEGLRATEIVKLEGSRAIYRHYIEREKIKPDKEKCLKLLGDPKYQELFRSEEQAKAQTKRFYEKKPVPKRSLQVQKQILKFYESASTQNRI